MAEAAEEQGHHVIGKGNEVIFVDDCEGDLVLAQLCYESCGAANQLVTFSRPKEFMEFLQAKKANRDPQPDVIFLDINMPGTDGFHVLAWLKQDPFRSVPVVFMLTNSANPADEDYARRLGAMDYFVKPNSANEFVDIPRKIRV